MKKLDVMLQHMRMDQAAAWIRQGSHVLDIGSFDGALFRRHQSLIAGGIGIDPLAPNENHGRYELVKGMFPEALHKQQPFDAITLLAVLEHIPANAQQQLAKACAQWLRPGGRLIITVPSPMVDHILVLLKTLRLIDGMSTEEHYGYDIRNTPELFKNAGFTLIHHKTFQLGLNHLFVFEKI